MMKYSAFTTRDSTSRPDALLYLVLCSLLLGGCGGRDGDAVNDRNIPRPVMTAPIAWQTE